MDPIALKCGRCSTVSVFEANTQDQVCCKAVYDGKVCHSRVFFKIRPNTTVRLR